MCEVSSQLRGIPLPAGWRPREDARHADRSPDHRPRDARVLPADRGRVPRRLVAGSQHLPPERRDQQHRAGHHEPGHRRRQPAARGAALHAGLRPVRAARSRCPLGGGVGGGAGVLRPVLLLAPPARPHRRAVLGRACRAPPERGLQPVDRAAPDVQRVGGRLAVLPADGSARRAPGGVRRRRADRPALPVLGAHAADRPARRVRPLVLRAEQPPRAPRGQRQVPRPQLRRHPARLGPPVRQLRRRGRRRALRLRHTGAAAQLEPGLGQPAQLLGHGAGQLARPALGRQAARVVQAPGLAAGRRRHRPGRSACSPTTSSTTGTTAPATASPCSGPRTSFITRARTTTCRPRCARPRAAGWSAGSSTCRWRSPAFRRSSSRSSR